LSKLGIAFLAEVEDVHSMATLTKNNPWVDEADFLINVIYLRNTQMPQTVPEPPAHSIYTLGSTEFASQQISYD